MQTLPTTSPTATTGQRPRRWRRGAALVFTLLAMSFAAIPGQATAPSRTEAPGRTGPAEDPQPSEFHGNWRVVAGDDRHDQALMQVSIIHGRGDRLGSGDYVLFQPFCDVLANAPVTGDGDCEVIGDSDVFERVQSRRHWLVLVFRPTADGQAHTLAVRRAGTRLVGEYRNGDGARAVVLQPTG